MFLLLFLKGIVFGVIQFWAKIAYDWRQVGSDLSGEAAGDSFGTSIALSADGKRVAIGAIYSDGNVENVVVSCGQVRIYDWVGSQWTQVGSDFNGEAIGDFLGSSVALSSDGNRVAIWAPRHYESGGQVRLYDWNGTHWTQVGSDLNGEAGRDNFAGMALSADGNRLAVGVVDYARHENNLVDILVRIYDWIGSQWTQVGSDLSIIAAQSGRDWSFALSADGKRVAVSRALGGEGDGVDVRIYDLTGSEWTQVGSDLSIAEGISLDRSMVALSEDGNRLATGVRGYHSLREVGRVRVFDWNGSQWTQLGSDLDFGWLGSNMALSADGNRLAINAPTQNFLDQYTGVVHIYDWTGSQWIQVGSDLEGRGTARSGIAISADGSHLAINTDGDIERWGGFDVDAGNVRIYAFE